EQRVAATFDEGRVQVRRQREQLLAAHHDERRRAAGRQRPPAELVVVAEAVRAGLAEGLDVRDVGAGGGRGEDGSERDPSVHRALGARGAWSDARVPRVAGYFGGPVAGGDSAAEYSGSAFVASPISSAMPSATRYTAKPASWWLPSQRISHAIVA